MYIEQTSLFPFRSSACPVEPLRSGRYVSRTGSSASRFGWMVAGTLGVLTAPALEAQSGTADWPTSQLLLPIGIEAPAALLRSAFDSAQTIQHIRAVLGLSVTELSRLLGVSRQSVHDWSKGRAVSQENGDKLAKISTLADVLVEAQIEVSPYILRRSLSSGKSLLETALSVDDVADSTRKIVMVLLREAKQRSLVAERLAGRKPQAQELNRYIAPRLTEAD
jgi:transcriptional regulator with XRE-family HTH domain